LPHVQLSSGSSSMQGLIGRRWLCGTACYPALAVVIVSSTGLDARPI